MQGGDLIRRAKQSGGESQGWCRTQKDRENEEKGNRKKVQEDDLDSHKPPSCHPDSISFYFNPPFPACASSIPQTSRLKKKFSIWGLAGTKAGEFQGSLKGRGPRKYKKIQVKGKTIGWWRLNIMRKKTEQIHFYLLSSSYWVRALSRKALLLLCLRILIFIYLCMISQFGGKTELSHI